MNKVSYILDLEGTIYKKRDIRIIIDALRIIKRS